MDFLTQMNIPPPQVPVSPEGYVIIPKYFGTVNFLSEPWICAYYHIRIICVNQIPNSKVLLRILLQFTCNKTSDLPSTWCDPVVITHSSLVSTSDSFLVGFIATSTLSIVFQVRIRFYWIENFRVLSDAPSVEFPSIRCQSFFLLPPSPLTLEYT